ncbi:MAG: hypothetical protein HKN75_11930, partial [Bacteroidia bacterium]|nr:hypothetical protein [Bacteroidia bacterium]
GTIRFQNLAGLGNRPVMTDAAGNLFAGAAGSGGWQTTGNAGTFSSNFIGTTDNQSFKIRTNNVQRAVVLNNGQFLVGTAASIGNYQFQSKASSSYGVGVYGESINNVNSYGVYGRGITNGIGVYGESGTTRPGVVGVMQGVAPKFYSGNSAVAGTGTSVGLFGAATNLTLSSGVLGFGNNLSGGSLNTDGAGVAGIGSKIGVFGQSINTGTNPISASGGYFVQGPAFGYVGVRQITPNINFKIVGSGTVSTIVRDKDENPVLMFAPEAPEVLFQDYGIGQLVNGFAHIELDPIFAKNIHVDETHPLRVYIQPEGNCKGVYVLNKTKNSFEIRELDGGTSSITFSYMIVANRADEVDLDTEYTKARFPRGPEALPLKEIKAVQDKE